MAKRRSRAEREREVAAWRASGLSAGAYAAHRGYSRASLCSWAADLSPKTPQFVRLDVAPRAASELVIEIGKARLHVARGFDASLLRDVVAALAAEVR